MSRAQAAPRSPLLGSTGIAGALSIKNTNNHSIQTDLMPNSTYTFTTTIPHSATTAPTGTKKVTTIRASKKSPIIINLGSTGPVMPLTKLESVSVNDSGSGTYSEIHSPSLSSSGATTASSPLVSPRSQSLKQSFSSSAPVKGADTVMRNELAKEVRARIKVQQQARTDYQSYRQERDATQAEISALKALIQSLEAQLRQERDSHAHSQSHLDRTTDKTSTTNVTFALSLPVTTGANVTELQHRLSSMDAAHGDLLSKWEQTIQHWNEEKELWAKERQHYQSQLLVNDTVIAQHRNDNESLSYGLQSLSNEKEELDALCQSSLAKSSLLTRQVVDWQMKHESLVKQLTVLQAEYEEYKINAQSLLLTHMQNISVEAIKQTAATITDTDTAPKPNLSLTGSLASPLLVSQDAVSVEPFELSTSEIEAKYNDDSDSGSIALNESVTIVVSDATQSSATASVAASELSAIASAMNASHTALHRHIRSSSFNSAETVASMKAQLADYQSQIHSLLESNSIHQTSLLVAETRYQKLWKQLGQQLNVAAKLKSETQVSGQKFDTLLAESEQRIQHLHSELNSERCKVQSLNDKLAETQQQVTNGTAIYMDYLNQLTQTQALVKELTENSATMTTKIQSLEQSLAEQSQRSAEMSAVIEELESTLTVKESMIETMSTNLEQQSSVIDSMTMKLTAQESVIEQLTENNQFSRLSLENSNHTIDTLHSTLSSTTRAWQSKENAWLKEKETMEAEKQYMLVSMRDSELTLNDQSQLIQQFQSKTKQTEHELVATQRTSNKFQAKLQLTKTELVEQQEHVRALKQAINEEEEFREQRSQREAVANRSVRTKLGSMIQQLKQKLQLSRKETKELKSVLLLTKRALKQTEHRAARDIETLEHSQTKLIRERDEFSSVLTEALKELKKKENSIHENEREIEANELTLVLANKDKCELVYVLNNAMRSLTNIEAQHQSLMESSAATIDELTHERDEFHTVLASAIQELKSRDSDATENSAAIVNDKHELFASLTEAVQSLRALEDRYESAKSRMLVLKKERDEYRTVFDDSLEELKKKEQEIYYLHTCNDEKDSEIVSLTARSQAMRQSLQMLEVEHSKLMRESSEVIERLTSENSQCHTELQSFQALIEQREQIASKNDELLAVLYQQIERSDRELQALRESNNHGLVEALTNELRQVKVLCDQQSLMIGELTRVKDDLQTMVGILMDKHILVSMKTDEEKALEERELSLRRELEKTHNELVRCESERASTLAAMDSLKSQLVVSEHSTELVQARLDDKVRELQRAKTELVAATDSVKHGEELLADRDDELSEAKQALMQFENQSLQTDAKFKLAQRAVKAADFAIKHLQRSRQSSDCQRDTKLSHLNGVINTIRLRLNQVYRERQQLSEVLLESIADNDSYRAELSEAESQVSTLQSIIKSLDTDLGTSRSKIGELRLEIQSLRKSQGEDAQEIAHQTQQLEALQSKCQSLEFQLEATHGQLAQKQAAYNKLTAEVESKQSQIIDTLAWLQRTQEHLETVEKENQSLQSKNSELTESLIAQAAGQKAHVASLESQLLRLQTEHDASHNHMDQLVRNLDDAKHAYGISEQTLAEQVNEIEILTETIQSLRQEVKEVNDSNESLQSQYSLLEAEYQRHNDEDHRQMDEQSQRWQQQHDQLQAQLQSVTEQFTASATDNKKCHELLEEATADMTQLQRELDTVTADNESLSQQLTESRETLIQYETVKQEFHSLTIQHSQLVQQFSASEGEVARLNGTVDELLVNEAQHTTERQQVATALANKDEELISVERQLLQAEKLNEELSVQLEEKVKIIEGQASNRELNAMMEMQAAVIESQLSASQLTPEEPLSPLSPSSAPSSHKRLTVATQRPNSANPDGRDPMTKVHEANAKKEIAKLQKLLEKSTTERRSLEKRVHELDKRMVSLSKEKNQAAYHATAAIEEHKTYTKKLQAFELTVQELTKERSTLVAQFNDTQSRLELRDIDLTRMAAAEKEREAHVSVLTKQWQEQRASYEARIAALHGRIGKRGGKRSGGSSVTFDDSASHIMDLRCEINELQTENARLRSLIERFPTDIALIAGPSDASLPIAEDDEESEGNFHSTEEEEDDGECEVEVDEVSISTSVSQYQAVEREESQVIRL